ncbi:MAG: LysR family transcriptional regulator [Kofleriaceae bacterium]|nr:LysR family transcriptional regulator [Kofleriaceae bacterium]
MDRLGNIEAFVSAAELGSLTLAARRLGLSPSALSRRITQLEAEVGVRLLHRTTRTVRLSEEGRAYFERSRGALRELEEARDLAATSRERPAGLLRIEAPTILGRFVVVPAVAQLVRKYPDVEVDLALRDVPADLFTDSIDVALRMGPLPSSGLIARKLGTTWLRVCAAPSYLKRNGVPRSLDALGRHERLGYAVHGRATPWRLRDGDEVRELVPSSRIAVNTAEALIDLAVGGAGLAWMCEFMMNPRVGKLVEVLPKTACVSAPIHAVTLPTRNKLPKVSAFVELVVAELAKQGVQTIR